jgi:outer membrane protein TolC
MKNKQKILRFFLLVKILYLAFNFIFYNQVLAKNPKAEESTKPTLLVDKIIESSQKNYPQILNFYEKVAIKEGKILESQGFFDVKIKNQYQDKSRGFYDGKINDISLEKQNGFLGSKIYGGYRKSFGNFADYDGNNLTNDEGEYRIGGSFSLLRNRGIDSGRLDLITSQLELQESKIQLEKVKNEISRDAVKSYWNWVIAGYIYQTYENLYELAKKRDSQLKIRHQKGDIAQIILIENHRNVLNRRSLMQEAKNNFDNSVLALSMYYRKDSGEMLMAKIDEIPKIDFNLAKNLSTQLENDVDNGLKNRPELRILKIQNDQENNNLLQAKNLYQPKLDLQLEASKDLGDGTKSRAQTNNQVKLDFELPLQQNVAKGKIASTSSKIKAIKYEEQFYRDKIRTEILQLHNSLKNVLQIYSNYLEELKLSQILEKAEKERFQNGHSDFFLINLREQEVATAKINKLVSILRYQSIQADYNFAIWLRN